ncbi:hypothetical protein HUA74_21010 [Myxococcus sp. CA051A]|nr:MULTISPECIES: DUF1629 domain-containing protein [unclassified Myxococcus]NTX37453.1 hypothetical protein [Myxococcus sp. CA033]NTX50187.1 hypothetical protein [Myxococcus sp. CA039A]NTX63133.1 hypothetical protein [Myxococcus sp. CA051A]
MPERYFELTEDMSMPGRWALGTPTDAGGRELDDPWAFTDGRALPDPGRLRVPVVTPGKALGFTRAGLCIPVVHAGVAAVFSAFAPGDVQLIPVEVREQAEPFYILVATRLVRCIDDQASRFIERWTTEDEQPEKVGEYRNVRGLRIDPTQVGSTRVFRPWGWNVALIVSLGIREALEQGDTTGMKFTEV